MIARGINNFCRSTVISFLNRRVDSVSEKREDPAGTRQNRSLSFTSSFQTLSYISRPGIFHLMVPSDFCDSNVVLVKRVAVRKRARGRETQTSFGKFWKLYQSSRYSRMASTRSAFLVPADIFRDLAKSFNMATVHFSNCRYM